MPLSRTVARFNRRFTNRVFGTFAPVAPGFGVIVHIGRKSGRSYRTPVNLFATDGGYLVALTYGRESDWVRNVLAADGCEAIVRGRTLQLHAPEIVHDPARSRMHFPARQFLGLIGVVDFLLLRS